MRDGAGGTPRPRPAPRIEGYERVEDPAYTLPPWSTAMTGKRFWMLVPTGPERSDEPDRRERDDRET